MYNRGNASPKTYRFGYDHSLSSVDKKRVDSCILKHLFLEGVEQTKTSPTKPGNALSDAPLMSRFQNFAGKKPRSARF